MIKQVFLAAALALGLTASAYAHPGGLTDAQIAHIAYTAGQIDITAADQAGQVTSPQVRSFAETMKRDHAAVNDQALALLGKLKVTPQANPTSEALATQAAAKQAELAKLQGAAFDPAYLQNEIAFHQTVNGALETTLIPGAHNAELKALLETGLKLFREHQTHAEHVAAALK